MKNNIKVIIFLLFIMIWTTSIIAVPNPSPRRTASGDFSDDIYDTYDFITTRPDLLTRVERGEIIFYPDELVNDISSLVNIINSNPELNFNNRIGFAYNSGKFAFGLHFLNHYTKNFLTNPTDTRTTTLSDNDNDGIFTENTEIETTVRSSQTNYIGNEDLDYGAGFVIPSGKIFFGISYQRIGDDVVSTGNWDYESYNNNYSLATLNTKTNITITQKSKTMDSQHIFMLNFGIDKITQSTNLMITSRSPLFLLQTKFIIFNDHLITRNKKRGVYDSDPSQLISPTLYNKRIVEGDAQNPLEADTDFDGYKLEVLPRFTFTASPSLHYNLQLQFGYGLSISYSNYSKNVNSYTNLGTDPAGLYQDKILSYSENLNDYKGDKDYLKYGLRIEQVFKPKYFVVGVALSATVEHDSLNYNGMTSWMEKTNYASTFTNHHLSDNATEKRYTTIVYPDTRASVEQKNITTTLSIPAGFEFDVLNWLKFRISYTYSIQKIYSVTTTSTTNGGQIAATTYYEDPALNSTVVYSSTGSRTETTSTAVSSTQNISQYLSSGFEIILSRKIVMNISGTYTINDTASPTALFLAETKFKF